MLRKSLAGTRHFAISFPAGARQPAPPTRLPTPSRDPLYNLRVLTMFDSDAIVPDNMIKTLEVSLPESGFGTG
jgi:hypothetical protein